MRGGALQRERGAEYRAIFELTGVGMVQTDLATGRFVRANPRMCEITGYPEEELLGLTFADITHPDDRGADSQSLARLVEGETLEYQTEKRHLRKDGSVVWVSVDARAVRDEAGRPVHAVAAVQDITGRRRNEEALRASLKELSDLKFALDESAIVAFTDQKGRITYVNDKFCEVSKYSRDELIGQDHRIINSAYHPKEFIRDLWRTIAQGRVWRGELRNQAKDGSIYWVDTTIVPFLDERGKPYQYVAIRYEITDRKQVEEDLRESNALLNSVIEGTSDAIFLKDI